MNNLERSEAGQATAEYALVIVAAAAIALALIVWRRRRGPCRTSSTPSSPRSPRTCDRAPGDGRTRKRGDQVCARRSHCAPRPARCGRGRRRRPYPARGGACRRGGGEAAASPDPADAVAAVQAALGQASPRARISVHRPHVVGAAAEVVVELPHEPVGPCSAVPPSRCAAVRPCGSSDQCDHRTPCGERRCGRARRRDHRPRHDRC